MPASELYFPNNPRKAQPTFGGAMKLYLSKKMFKESTEYGFYNIR
jgi:hypothetical protein